ncbi:MAG TPA: DUF1028 domain-containing protein [Candidatus Bathyarchaeia archaeon]|nr:DUF1028 domain-containing protein [Candidatus Bathyarchaeia archaeon]
MHLQRKARIMRAKHTFSIVSRDSKTGEIGVAVQSHWFSVGGDVSWAWAGFGAVATQAFADPSYGSRGLALMHQGKSAPDALKQLINTDPQQEVRQVAIVDAKGRVAVHTGRRCVMHAGHKIGEGHSVQANMMLNDMVLSAMAKAFERTRGDLANRMMASLEAAQRAGGDIRGKQSAAILVVRAQSSGELWTDRVVDLRVDDHPEPIMELRRLLIPCAMINTNTPNMSQIPVSNSQKPRTQTHKMFGLTRTHIHV